MENARQFANYARQHGRADLAKQAPVLAANNNAVLRRIEAEENQFQAAQMGNMQRIFIPWVLGRALVVQILALVFALFVVTIAAKISKNVPPTKAINNRDVWRLFGILCVAFLILLAFLWRGDGGVRALTFGGWFDNGPGPDERLKSDISLGFFAFGPLVLGFLGVTCVLAWRNRRWRRENPPDETQLARLKAPLRGGLYLIGRFWFYGLGALCVCWWLIFVLQNVADISFDDFLTAFGLSSLQGWEAPLAATVLWFCALAALRPGRVTPWRGYGTRWMQRLLLLWLIVASWTYCGLLLSSLPARAQAETRLQKYLRSES